MDPDLEIEKIHHHREIDDEILDETEWKYFIVQIKNMEALNDNEVQEEVKNNKFFLYKSNMFNEENIDLEELKPKNEKDELMLWKQWPALKGYNNIGCLIKDKRIDLLHLLYPNLELTFN